MIGRAVGFAVVVVTMRLYTAHADVERPAPREPLATLPVQIGEWRGAEGVALSPEAIAAAGVDDYLSRVYADGRRRAVSLYIGYYASQRQGDTIHSPQNCLPGAGWQPVASTRRSIATAAGRVEANDMLIEKGVDRAVVLYWYEGRGRIVADEYMNKLSLMLDAARLHRTDGGLVRIIAPVANDAAASAADAASFAAVLVPHLTRRLP